MPPFVIFDPQAAVYFMLIFGIDDAFIMLALFAASALLSALTTKAPTRPANAVPAGLGEFDIPQIAEGTPQTIVFGDCWIKDPQILWYGNLRSEAITKSVGGGKK